MKTSIIILAHDSKLVQVITGTVIFLVALIACTPLTASPVQVNTIMTLNPIIFSATPLTPTPTPTTTTITVPTATMTATPSSTNTPTPTPTEIPKIVLSADGLKPTRIKWEQIQGITKAEFVSADGVTFLGQKGAWDQTFDYSYINGKKSTKYGVVVSYLQNGGWLRPNSILPRIVAENIHNDGWAIATSPNGKDVLFLQESVKTMDGKGGTWLFAFREGILHEDWYTIRHWFGLEKGMVSFVPTACEDSSKCVLDTSIDKDIFNGRLSGDVDFVWEFIKTGNIPKGMSDGYWIGTPYLNQ
jgi:hypothetical protein